MVLLALAAAPAAVAQTATGDGAAPTHAMVMYGQPRYPEGFTHLDYANPDAPRGGTLELAAIGSFDSLNPFVVFGRTAEGVRGYHFASLMARTWDEPFSLYGYVAERVELAADRRTVTFYLNPAARFHDGSPITVDDVIFTVETLREDGLPGFRRNYARIDRMEPVGEHGIRFHLTSEADRETPMILGLMPILSQAWFTEHPFGDPTLEVPLGSGPYRIAEVEPGRRITFQRVEDWWGDDLPVFRGHFNFDRIVYDYFLDEGVAMEAFRTGAQSLRREWDGVRWASLYSFPAVDDGRVTLLEEPHRRPSGLRGLAMNTRRPPFDDIRVREALAYALDSEWIGSNLLLGQYQRITGMFTNSPLAPEGSPSDAELALLAPWRGLVPDRVFGPAYEPPSTAGGGLRANLRHARDLLVEAGFTVADGRMLRPDGRPFAFELLLASNRDEPMALAYADSLRRIGIELTIRQADNVAYVNRLTAFDFDMTIDRWNVTLSPGAEQDLYWGSHSAGIEGSRNLTGLALPAVDALIDTLENAEEPEELAAAASALDRVIMWEFVVIPLFYLDEDYIAYWGDLRRVEGADPLYGTVLETWWEGSAGE
ncbi:MAG: ABC transporter substrate-binding protein [Rhodospirillaceae bacterium]|nr:ABC transporter substrate-binding protein [Rhodospirillaceae bacterium]